MNWFECVKGGFEGGVAAFEFLPLHGEGGVEEQYDGAGRGLGGGRGLVLALWIGEQELRLEETRFGNGRALCRDRFTGGWQRRVWVAVGDDFELVGGCLREKPGGPKVFIKRKIGGAESSFDGMRVVGREC